MKLKESMKWLSIFKIMHKLALLDIYQSTWKKVPVLLKGKVTCPDRSRIMTQLRISIKVQEEIRDKLKEFKVQIKIKRTGYLLSRTSSVPIQIKIP
jgi:hypothetical protein